MRSLLAALVVALMLGACAKYEMTVEYVTVAYPGNRPVYIDHERNGSTNEVLRVGTGSHQFDLGAEQDYAPGSYTLMVKDTTVLVPLVLEFKRKSDP